MRTQSFSSLSTYANCPLQYHLQYNERVIPYQETEATRYGTRVHQALEDYCRSGTMPADDIKPFLPFADKILSLGGEMFIERQFALSHEFRPAEFDDASAWLRGVVDIGTVAGDRALVGDWKTGKIRPDSDQLKLFAGFILTHYPAVEKVKTAYIWLKFGKITTESYTRDDLPGILDYFLGKTHRIVLSYARAKWLPKPSGLCNGWCGAGAEHCDFWKPRRS